MPLRTVRNIVLAFVIAISSGLLVRQVTPAPIPAESPIECTDDALRTALQAQASITLPQQCILYLSDTLTIDKAVTLQATGAALIGSYNAPHRLLHVTPSGELTLRGMALVSGRVDNAAQDIVAGGAGLYNEGRAALYNTVLLGNRAYRATGAGIFNAAGAVLLLEGTEIRGSYVQGAAGAALHNLGEATLRNSTLHYNTAAEVDMDEMAGMAGGIFNQGALLLEDSYVTHNVASRFTGLLNVGRLLMRNSDISHNSVAPSNACTGDGAGFVNESGGRAIILDSRISYNAAAKSAGGILNRGDLRARRTEVIGNSSCNGIPGILNVFGGRLSILDSVIMDNRTASGQPIGLLNYGDEEHPAWAVAIRNYWGSADGPSGVGAGQGDAVVGIEADAFTPWLRSLPAYSSRSVSVGR